MSEASNAPIAVEAQQYGKVLAAVFLAEGLVIVAVAVFTGTAPHTAVGAYLWGAAWFGVLWNGGMAVFAAGYWLWLRARRRPPRRHPELPEGIRIGGARDALRTLRRASLPTFALPVLLALIGSGTHAALLAGFSLVGAVDLTAVSLWRWWRTDKTGERLYLVRQQKRRTEWYVRRSPA